MQNFLIKTRGQTGVNRSAPGGDNGAHDQAAFDISFCPVKGPFQGPINGVRFQIFYKDRHGDIRYICSNAYRS